MKIRKVLLVVSAAFVLALAGCSEASTSGGTESQKTRFSIYMLEGMSCEAAAVAARRAAKVALANGGSGKDKIHTRSMVRQGLALSYFEKGERAPSRKNIKRVTADVREYLMGIDPPQRPNTASVGKIYREACEKGLVLKDLPRPRS